MVALALHNWMSAAAGIAVAIAVIRGFARHSAQGLGNFWVDVTRASLYVLLPICLVGALVLVWQGVPQNFSPYVQAKTLEGATQTLAQGPVASQEVIKELGTNGGGFFNANSAHPYESPTPLTNFLEMLLIFLIPAGLTYTFGRMVGKQRQGWALFGAMTIMFAVGLGICYRSEAGGTPAAAHLGLMTTATADQPGGNMEGKETRFGIGGSALFATVTTDASCGAVNSMHDSFTPLGGAVPLMNLMCDEVIFGGVGSGLYGMLMYAVIAVFIAGLMVGRTPEYVGKKIEQYEVRMAILAVLILAGTVLLGSALAATLSPPGGPVNASLGNSGAHGFSEMMYAYASAVGNNGSAFAGLNANVPFYNTTLGLAMLVGRFLMIVPLLALAGSLARKKLVPLSAGTLATDTWLFAGLLAAIVVVIGALEYFPALSLGPIVEHFQMLSGKLF
jgi:K+-transporting ATPase ATPase A chain